MWCFAMFSLLTLWQLDGEWSAEGIAEADSAEDSEEKAGSVRSLQVPPRAPKHSNPNLLPIGETFGFVVFLKDVK